MTSHVAAPPGTIGIKSRLDWADFCRVCAIFGVIVIHASVQLLQPRGKIPLDEWRGGGQYSLNGLFAFGGYFLFGRIIF